MATTPKGIKYPDNYSEIADIPEVMKDMAESIDGILENQDNKIENKVEKEIGKGLSTNDFTNEEKNKLAELENYDDTEIKEDILEMQDDISNLNTDITDLNTNKADKTEIPTTLAELTDDSTHRTVTDAEKTNWSNKSDFSGNYNDLTNKPDLSEFITKTVDDLVNYYKKSETYTQTEVNNLIGAIQQFHYEIVQTLPQTGANNILYLIPSSTSEIQNVYDEYVYANNDWEKIGSTQIDLSNYYTKAQVEALIPVVPTNISEFTNDAGYLTQHQDISGKEDKSNKTTSINENSTNIQYPGAKCVYDSQKIQDDNIEALESLIPKGQASGESITINDSANYSFRNVDLGGNTEQKSYTGKNKIGLVDGTYTSSNNASTLTVKDGIISFSGNVGAEAVEFRIPLIDNITLENNTTNTFSIKGEGTLKNYVIASRLLTSVDATDANSFGKSFATILNNNASITYTQTEQQTFSYAYLYIAANTNNLNFELYYQLEQGSSATSYEPYVGGTASPNPDYPQEIQNVGNNVNLFDASTINESKYVGGGDGNLYDSASSNATDYIEVKENEIYTLSYDYSSLVTSSDRGIVFYNSSKTYISGTSYSPTNKIKDITTPANTKYIRITLDKNFNNIKVEKGINKSGYTPYNRAGIDVKVQNKNLIEITENNMLARCSYVSGANTNEYKLLCIASDMYVNEISSVGVSYNKSRNGNLIPCKYGETIYFDLGNSLFAKNFINEFDENLVSLGFYDKYVSEGTYTPKNSNCKYITLRFGYGTNAVAGTTYTLAPIICKTSDTSYVPYEEQTATLPLPEGMELCKIGDYQDKIFKNTKNSTMYNSSLIEGAWYKYSAIGKKIFDGTENWYKGADAHQTENTNLFYTFSIDRSKAFGKTNLICDKFIVRDIIDASNDFVGICGQSNNALIYIRIDQQLTANEFKTWVTNNNLPLYYALATPTYERITDTDFIEQAENMLKMKSYKGTTYISSDDEISPNFEVEYYKDIELMIQNLLNQ